MSLAQSMPPPVVAMSHVCASNIGGVNRQILAQHDNLVSRKNIMLRNNILRVYFYSQEKSTIISLLSLPTVVVMEVTKGGLLWKCVSCCRIPLELACWRRWRQSYKLFLSSLHIALRKLIRLPEPKRQITAAAVELSLLRARLSNHARLIAKTFYNSVCMNCNAAV